MCFNSLGSTTCIVLSVVARVFNSQLCDHEQIMYFKYPHLSDLFVCDLKHSLYPLFDCLICVHGHMLGNFVYKEENEEIKVFSHIFMKNIVYYNLTPAWNLAAFIMLYTLLCV